MNTLTSIFNFAKAGADKAANFLFGGFSKSAVEASASAGLAFGIFGATTGALIGSTPEATAAGFAIGSVIPATVYTSAAIGTHWGGKAFDKVNRGTLSKMANNLFGGFSKPVVEASASAGLVFGIFGATTGALIGGTPEATAAGFAVGSAIPATVYSSFAIGTHWGGKAFQALTR